MEPSCDSAPNVRRERALLLIDEIRACEQQLLCMHSNLAALREQLRDVAPDRVSSDAPTTYVSEGESPRDARCRLERLLDGMLDIGVLHNDLGVLCFEMGDKEEALSNFHAASVIDESNVIAKSNLADLCASLGKADRAISIYQELLDRNPEDTESKVALSCLRASEHAKILVNSETPLSPSFVETGTTRFSEDGYQAQIRAEIKTYRDVVNVHDLPAINHHVNNALISPLLAELTGETDFMTWWANEIRSLAGSVKRPVRALSVGTGNGDLEIDCVKRAGAPELFSLLGIDINPHMIARANETAQKNQLPNCEFRVGDFNALQLDGTFDMVIANQSLHHVVELERLFAAIDRHASDDLIILVNDMIGRNGHVMWPNAERVVTDLWDFLDEKIKLNRHTRQYDRTPMNCDFSGQGFEGIRAQDILPLLNTSFDIDLFLPFNALLNRFVDRTYGHNFRMDEPEDVALAEGLTKLERKLLSEKKLAPTQAFMRLRKKGFGRELRHRFQTPSESLIARTCEVLRSEYLPESFCVAGKDVTDRRGEIFADVFG